jgi:hypothetical protein
MTLGGTCQVMKMTLRVALQLVSGFKKLGVQNKPRWTLLWDSSLETSFSNQEEYFLELVCRDLAGK